MGGIARRFQGIKDFYFRPGHFVAVTGGIWIYFLVTSLLFIYLTVRGFYSLFMSGDDFCFCYLLCFFYFYWLWKTSLRVFRMTWDDAGYNLGRRMAILAIILLFHIFSMAGYLWVHATISELPSHLSIFDALSFLSNPIVLGILAAVFLYLMRLRRYGPASFIWATVGYYLVFALLPERSGNAIHNLESLRGVGEQSWSLLSFLGANVVVLFGLIYLIFIKGESND
ncbi:MAG: hypothetical protein JW821_01540 [Deltaproteobacteria bacterium]|nr:hypothetical protein [Deltaproteobacteria bacterium]